jgi:hypothetical protein
VRPHVDAQLGEDGLGKVFGYRAGWASQN